MFHNSIVKISEKIEQAEVDENLPPSYLPYRFLHNLHSFLLWEKVNIFDFLLTSSIGNGGSRALPDRTAEAPTCGGGFWTTSQIRSSRPSRVDRLLWRISCQGYRCFGYHIVGVLGHP